MLNAYIKLLVTKRCHKNAVRQDQAQFHIFDTLFYYALNSLVQNDNYDFLKLGFYFDKHYMSPKRIAKTSIFLFLVPCPDQPREFAIVVADLSSRRFVIFDPLEGSAIGDYIQVVDALKVFLADYIDNFPMRDQVEDDSDGDDGEQLLSVSHSDHANREH